MVDLLVEEYNCWQNAQLFFIHERTPMSAREERFPDIDWWCDRCHAHLNSQPDFDDHKRIWKCTECGHKNSISWDNTHDPLDNPFISAIGTALGLVRSASVFEIAILVLRQLDYAIPWAPIVQLLPYAVPVYLISFILSLFYHRFVLKGGSDKKLALWVAINIPIYFFDDLIRPFREFFEAIGAIITFHKYRIVSFLIKKIVFGALYLAIILILAVSVLSSSSFAALLP